MKEFKPFKEGKVREVYDNGDSLIIVATDRISAFDNILKNRITDKGAILTQMSKFWFDFTKDVVPNHMISVDVRDMPEFFQQERFDGNSMMCKKLEMLPIECIVRGYITGSGWASYKENGTVCGIKLPEGLVESDKLPEPIYTPSTKADLGDHDENISFEQSVDVLEKIYPGKGLDYATQIKDCTIALYKKCAEYALSKGIIIADTKFEFGLDENGKVVLGDEMLTPDSSRFWPLEGYKPGQGQPSFDKQYVRDWLKANPDNDFLLPEEVVTKTVDKYKEAYELLTGKPFTSKPFTVTDVSKKKGNEAPPHLYDLTSLQVDCNKKFAYSADITLKLIQSLYEKKYTTYPRVDTQFLTDDIYPKCPQILNGVSQAKIMSQQKYLPLIQQLATISKKLPKSKKVFDNSKVTDHHAIIPTGVPPTGLTDMEANVYDLIAKRFISVFYPDCKFSTTTVLGEVINEDGPKPEKIEFKVSGKEILEPGWRVVYAKDVKNADDDDASDNANGNADSGNGAKKEVVEERTLPSFTKGESGDHQPTLTEKWTTPPKYYTEATLLRAMETAGKFVEDEELRAALKENGIGRPSSRAGIIETLFKRHYIRRQRKNLMATPTGIELIDTIHEELLKSCELTGIWEKKLRDIEHKTYDPADFINGLKEQINKIVIDVLSDNSNRRVTIMTEEDLKKKPAAKKPTARKAPAKKADKAAAQNTDSQNAPAQPAPASDPMVGKPCPLCGKGVIIKGKTAYGCSNWKAGCQYRQPFSQM